MQASPVKARKNIGSLAQELQAIVSHIIWTLGTELGFSERGMSFRKSYLPCLKDYLASEYKTELSF